LVRTRKVTPAVRVSADDPPGPVMVSA